MACRVYALLYATVYAYLSGGSVPTHVHMSHDGCAQNERPRVVCQAASQAPKAWQGKPIGVSRVHPLFNIIHCLRCRVTARRAARLGSSRASLLLRSEKRSGAPRTWHPSGQCFQIRTIGTYRDFAQSVTLASSAPQPPHVRRMVRRAVGHEATRDRTRRQQTHHALH